MTMTVGYIVFGKFFDWVGTRLGFAISMVVGSFAIIAHAFVNSATSFSILRILLGGAESGKAPGAIKINAEWFPVKERALAIGFVNAGYSIAGVVAVPLVAYLAFHFNYQTIFILIGLTGLLWLIPWFVLSKALPMHHPLITDAERTFILHGHRETKGAGDCDVDGDALSTRNVLSHKQSWGLIFVYTALEPISLLCITWFPFYLVEVHGMDLEKYLTYGWIPYVGTFFGAILGGLLARVLLGIGWTLNKTRKFIITFGCMISLFALIAMMRFSGPFISVIIIAIGLFGFHAAVCNVQTLPADFFGAKAAGTLSGISFFSAAVLSLILSGVFPLLSQDGDYSTVFGIGIILILISLISFWVLCPNICRLRTIKNGGVNLETKEHDEQR